jgi:hypothetical protein
MLGKLTTWLRILGHDTVYAGSMKIGGEEENKNEDKAIVSLAQYETRILLTRDKNMARDARKRGVQCYYIKSDTVMEQLKELLYLGINLQPVPIRCSKCNARIRNLGGNDEDKAILEESDYIPQNMIGKKEFWICPRCGRIYWEGSHWKNMRERLDHTF